MLSRYEGGIYEVLSDEPVTLGEVVKVLGVNYRTARDVLMHLALMRRDVRCKASGRIHVFWRERDDVLCIGIIQYI